MQIRVNGQTKEILKTTTLARFITDTSKEPRHIVAELNGQIIKNADWTRHTLKDGDALELVTFVGGG